MRVEIVGPDLSKAFAGIAREHEGEFRAKAPAAVRESAGVLHGSITSMLQRTPAGSVSAPGQPPAEQTGELIKSFRISGRRTSAGAVEIVVGSADPKSARLEFGGRDRRGIYIAPRPYFRPAVNRVIREIHRILREVAG